MEFKPHEYQQFAINTIIDNKATGLFLDMGLGKTVSSLTAASSLILLAEVHKVLVIAPLKVAESTWDAEVEKWEHLKDLRVSKILGTQNQRLDAIQSDADIYIINRDNVTWLVDTLYKNWPFDMCIIDELSSFKSNRSKRFKSLKKVRPYFKWIVGLTGTPAPQGYMDLWAQIYLLDGGERLGKTITSYRDRYFTPNQRNGAVIFNYKLKDGAEKAINTKISDICVSMKAEDYLKLPERLDNEIKVELPKDAKKIYKELEAELVTELENTDIAANNSAVLSNKLLQLANGAIYTEDRNVIEVHEEKIKALHEIIDTSQSKPILVFYSYKHDLARINAFLDKKKIKHSELKTDKDLKDWNNGKIPVMLVHPASCAYGLNLQAGGHIIVWFGLTWSLELYQQANARLYRQGQKNAVIIHHIIAKDTVDEDVMRALQHKDFNQEKLLESIKARLGR